MILLGIAFEPVAERIFLQCCCQIFVAPVEVGAVQRSRARRGFFIERDIRPVAHKLNDIAIVRDSLLDVRYRFADLVNRYLLAINRCKPANIQRKIISFSAMNLSAISGSLIRFSGFGLVVRISNRRA